MVEGKTVDESRTIMTQIVMPDDTNNFDNLYGGRLVDWMDTLGVIVAQRHCNKNVVTASIDSLTFLAPIRRGDIVVLEGWINYTGHTSMEVEINVTAENPRNKTKVKACSVFLTYVAVDENLRPTPIPPLIVRTEEERRRFEEAKQRKIERLKLKKAALKQN